MYLLKCVRCDKFWYSWSYHAFCEDCREALEQKYPDEFAKFKTVTLKVRLIYKGDKDEGVKTKNER